MKLSEAIKMLQEAMEINGDVELLIETGEGHETINEMSFQIQPEGLTIDLTVSE